MAVLAKGKRLKKELSLFSVYTLATGATLGSGFFLLPALAAAEAGPLVVLSYLMAVIFLLPGILSKIELATAMPRSGGEYYFLDRSLGPLIGTIGGLGTWCALVLKTAFALIGIGAYLSLFGVTINVKWLAVAFAILFGIINLFGAGKSGVFQVVLVSGLLLLLVWFILTGVGKVDMSYFHPFVIKEKGWTGVVSATGLVCISFMGLTNVASVAEEVKDPERNLTWGILLALGTSLFVYGLGTFVIIGMVPAIQLYAGDTPSLTPVAEAADAMVGRWGAVMMTIAAVLAFMSVSNAGILSASRYPLAMSRDHLLPPWFRRLTTYKTPQNAVLATVGLILLFVLVLDPTKIAKLASAFLLLLFVFNCLAVIVMRASRIESYDPGFICPWYPWVQLAGIVGPLGLIVMMGWLPRLFTLGLITVGTCWYIGYARQRIARNGAIYHLFARWGQNRSEGLDRELRGILKEKGLREDDPYDEVISKATIIDITEQINFEQIVRRASEQLALHLPLEAEQLTSRFMEGTRVGATPVSKGVALPHIRLASLKQPLMVLVRVSIGVHVEVKTDFIENSTDHTIYTIIFLVSPKENAAQHLRLLAQVAQHIDAEQFMNDWLAARNEQQLKEILLREDRFLSLHLENKSSAAMFIGKSLDDLPIPSYSTIALIHRNNKTIIPDHSTVLQEGDRLTIIALPETIQQLKEKYGVI